MQKTHRRLHTKIKAGETITLDNGVRIVNPSQLQGVRIIVETPVQSGQSTKAVSANEIIKVG